MEMIQEEAKRIKLEKQEQDLAKARASAASIAGKKGLNFMSSLKSNFQSEHTLVGLVAPPEEDEALTTSQVSPRTCPCDPKRAALRMWPPSR